MDLQTTFDGPKLMRLMQDFEMSRVRIAEWFDLSRGQKKNCSSDQAMKKIFITIKRFVEFGSITTVYLFYCFLKYKYKICLSLCLPYCYVE